MYRKNFSHVLPLLFVWFSASSMGAVYYSGVDGVQATLFNAEGCSGCHNGDADRQFTLSYSAFETYASVYSGTSTAKKQAAIYEMYRRTGLGTGEADFMPVGGSSIGSTQRSKLLSWRTDGGLNHASPTLTTSSSVSGTNKYQQATSNSAYFTVTATVKDNGVDATSYNFEYGTSTSSPELPATAPSPDQVTASGSISKTLTGLECGSAYYFRVIASSASYANSKGNWQSTNTPACNTAPVINSLSATYAATEDIGFALDIDAADAEGNSITYALTKKPTGMTINATTGDISWTPYEGTVTSDYSVEVTVTAQDGGYDGVTADSQSFTINVTGVDDNPAISVIADTTAVEGNEYSYQVEVEDPDLGDDSFTYQLTNAPSGMLISASGVITWTPGNGVSTSGTVTVTARDTSNLAGTHDFIIMVSETNTAPSMAMIPNASVNESELFTYTVDVTDIDDTDIENDIHFSLSNAPSGMVISNLGVITWTPPEDQSSVSNISVSAADGGENGTAAVTRTFSITVNNLNNSPKLLGLIPSQTLNETETLSLDVSGYFNDVDTASDDLNWSLVAAPDGMSISDSGEINWITPQGSANTYTVTIILQDDFPQSVSTELTINVIFLDTDSDTIADYLDNCPTVFNTEQGNNEGDAEGDACDLDDDNDNIPDTIEIALGFDPLDSADGLLDSDGDGDTNAEEYLLCAAVSDASCSRIFNDTTPPVITTNGDQAVASTGYLTEVILTAIAVDGRDGATQLQLDNPGPFRPGVHVVTWTTFDEIGNTATAQQNIQVFPQVRFGGSKLIAEGDSVTVPLTLNGDAPSYPVIIQYEVSGSSNESDHDLLDGQIQIAIGTEASLVINITNDGETEIDETLNISLVSISDNAVLVDPSVYEIQITEKNIVPDVLLQVEQNAEIVPVVYQDQGVFRISAIAEDGNGDVMTYDWSESTPALNLTGDVSFFDLDPAALATGFYELSAEVSDGSDYVIQSLAFTITNLAPVLGTSDGDGDGISDQDEGLGDEDGDGVLDYLDPVNDSQQLHKNLSGSESQDLMKTESGFKLKIGQLSMENNSNGAKLGSQNIASLSDTTTERILTGDVLDFEIQGTNELNPMAKIVIPLSNPISEGAEYWKLDGDNWYKFNDSGNDYLASSARIDGVCPEPSSSLYIEGLKAFDECLLLVLEDGGPNDSDGRLNGVVRDPGSLTAPKTDSFIEKKNGLLEPTESPGGAGAINYLLMAFALSWLMLIRVRSRQLFCGVHNKVSVK